MAEQARLLTNKKIKVAKTILFWGLGILLVVALKQRVERIGAPSFSEDEIWQYRNKIVQEIEAGNYEVNNGVIDLPDEDIYEKVSDTKRVILAMDGDKTVIYFLKFAGMLEDSCGYIYYSDKIDKNLCNDGNEFITKKHLEGNWYFCSTR